MTQSRTAVLTRIELQPRTSPATERGVEVVRFHRPEPAPSGVRPASAGIAFEPRRSDELREAILAWLEEQP